MVKSTGTSSLTLAEPRYRSLAQSLEDRIASGALRAGERVTSLRRYAKEHGVSVGTALQAYLLLERRGFLEARERSGFYVRQGLADSTPEPETLPASPRPHSVALSALTGVVSRAQDEDLVPLGIAKINSALLPSDSLNRCARRILRRYPDHSADYEHPEISTLLKRQIARRLAAGGDRVPPENLSITNGATEALHIALRVLAKPGDEILVEAPTYYGLLESMAALGLRTVEVSSSPGEGPDLEALRAMLKRPKVKAVVLVVNGHNPLGYVLSDERKKAIVELAGEAGIPIIEDDVYGELCQQQMRPATLSAFDTTGSVILCSSFSKLIGPGFRIGYIQPGRFAQEVAEVKSLTNVSNAVLPQAIVGEFLASGQFDRFVLSLNRRIRDQLERLRKAVVDCFPPGTRVSRPAGGFVLWIQLPGKVPALDLYNRALAKGVGTLPGDVYAAGGKFGHYLRLSGGNPWTPQIEQAVETLGRLAHRSL